MAFKGMCCHCSRIISGNIYCRVAVCELDDQDEDDLERGLFETHDFCDAVTQLESGPSHVAPAVSNRQLYNRSTV